MSMFCLRSTVTEQSLFCAEKEKKSRHRKINKSLQTFNTILLDSDLDCDIELNSYNEINPLRTRIRRIHINIYVSCRMCNGLSYPEIANTKFKRAL